MSGVPEIRVLDSAQDVARAVARAFVDLVHHPVAPQKGAQVHDVVLTGGTIADLVHAEIAALAQDHPWEPWTVRYWWGDERFVAADSPDRNVGQARTAMLDALGITGSDYEMDVPSPETTRDARAAAEVYADLLRREGPVGDFDLMMLGIGPDGHCASLFPGHPALTVDDRDAVAVTDSPKPPPERVTLTFPRLNASREVWFLATGEGKAEAVSRALATAGSVEETPARGVRGRARTVWWLDRAAARDL